MDQAAANLFCAYQRQKYYKFYFIFFFPFFFHLPQFSFLFSHITLAPYSHSYSFLQCPYPTSFFLVWNFQCFLCFYSIPSSFFASSSYVFAGIVYYIFLFLAVRLHKALVKRYKVLCAVYVMYILT